MQGICNTWRILKKKKSTLFNNIMSPNPYLLFKRVIYLRPVLIICTLSDMIKNIKITPLTTQKGSLQLEVVISFIKYKYITYTTKNQRCDVDVRKTWVVHNVPSLINVKLIPEYVFWLKCQTIRFIENRAVSLRNKFCRSYRSYKYWTFQRIAINVLFWTS